MEPISLNKWNKRVNMVAKPLLWDVWTWLLFTEGHCFFCPRRRRFRTWLRWGGLKIPADIDDSEAAARTNLGRMCRGLNDTRVWRHIRCLWDTGRPFRIKLSYFLAGLGGYWPNVSLATHKEKNKFSPKLTTKHPGGVGNKPLKKNISWEDGNHRRKLTAYFRITKWGTIWK